jgi:hypothetical protein
VKRIALLTVLALAAAASASATATTGRTLRGQGMTLSLPVGWHGLVGPGGVQAADFVLGSRVRTSASLARVTRGHVHLMLTNGGPWVPYLPQYRRARAPLVLRRRDLLPGGLEGFAGNDLFARREVLLGGDMVELLADLGPKPHIASALRKVNAVLSTLRVPPLRVLKPLNGRLAADGVSLRLLDGWSGRIEIPSHRYGARVALRARRGRTRVDLLELGPAGLGRHLDLPIVLQGSGPIVRRIFSTGGRSFDLSVTAHSQGALDEANRLLATLGVVPRPWTFRCCSLSLRLPGNWGAALKPRNYPVLRLYGPGIRVVLAELKPHEYASGRILRRRGRRFRVEVTPASARAKADTVLATLRVMPRC